MENENDQDVQQETVDEEVQEEFAETPVEERPKLTLEQQRGILQRKLTKINKELGVEEPKPREEIKTKIETTEPDYAKLAFLRGEGVTHPDDQKIVQDEATRLKLPLTDILNMSHIKSQLESSKDQRDALAGMPKGRGKGGGQTQGDVDYWLAKGETPDDQELGEKVIAARIKKEQSSNKFSDDLFNA